MSLPTDYGPLVRELHARAAAQGRPVNGTFELTERCNLGCRMCYVRQSALDAARRASELSAAQWLEMARQAKAKGTIFLLLTGGEVLLRPDFFEIYIPLTRMGFILTLFTNGTIITDEIARELARTPPGRTEITIYGASAETCESITGVPGSFANCIRGIENLLKYNVPLGLKSTLTRRNVGELEAMREMARNWGLPFSAGWLLTGRRDRKPSEVADCRMSARECVELESRDRASATDWMEAAMRESDQNSKENFYCQAGKAAYVINPYGEMNVCLDLNQPASRPLEIGFEESWKEVQAFVDTAPPLCPDCLDCNARDFCHRCPAWSQIENENLTQPVPYLCEIAFARKELYKPALSGD